MVWYPSKRIMKLRTFFFTGVVSIASISLLVAEVQPNALFSDHMVLQQGQKVPVWGTADSGEKVTVQFGGQTVEAKAGKDGRWQAVLKSLKASAKPAELKINDLVIADVLVGEVWVCSGQSNMAMSVSGTLDAEEASKEAEAGKYGTLRLFKVGVDGADEREANVDSQWAICSGSTVNGFSATGFYFGRALNRDSDVPVGLIQAASGGTNAHSWINSETLKNDAVAEDTRSFWAAAVKAHPAAMERFEKAKVAWAEKVKAAKAAGETVAGRAPREPVGPTHVKRPAGHYNAMIAPLQPYAVAGAIWYQGEANSRVPYAPHYRDLMGALIEDWRADWAEASGLERRDFPFYVVQLPNFANGDAWGWPVIREQMMRIWEEVPNTGTVVTIDVGDKTDIHPKDKMPVGERLAVFARGDHYGEKIEYSGPVYESMEVKGKRAVLSFNHVGTGLATTDGKGLTNFAIAGDDMEFVEARAVIKGERVVVSAKGVEAPVAVRYAWKNDPEGANFSNKEGLLASPFRTDVGEIPAPE